MEKQKKGWSWLGFLFTPYYYGGYGNLKKGLILAVISGLMPLLAIVVAFYGGVKAKKDLPVGKIQFIWKNVVVIFLVLVFVSVASFTAIQAMVGS